MDCFAVVSSQSRLQRGLMKYVCFFYYIYNICRTACLFATELNLLIHHCNLHKTNSQSVIHHYKTQECLVKMDCCVEGPAHSQGANRC